MSDTNPFSFENINKSRKETLLKSFSSEVNEFNNSDIDNEISKAIELETIEKGGKRATLGEIREWNGKKYQKTTQGWKPYGGKGLSHGDVDVTGQKDTPIPKEDKTLEDKVRDLKNALKTHGEAMHINPKAVSLPHVKKLIENGDVVYSAENNTIKLIHDDKKDTPIPKEKESDTKLFEKIYEKINSEELKQFPATRNRLTEIATSIRRGDKLDESDLKTLEMNKIDHKSEKIDKEDSKPKEKDEADKQDDKRMKKHIAALEAGYSEQEADRYANGKLNLDLSKDSKPKEDKKDSELKVDREVPKELSSFLDKFPDDTKTWSKATDEIRDVAEFIDELNQTKTALTQRINDPGERNKTHKQRITNGWINLSKENKQRVLDHFSSFFK